MAESVPRLALSHGQVLWCLAGGKEPTPPLPDQVRYLRQLDIPFAPHELGKGRGVRLSYGFYQLIELGIAYEGLRRRIEPRFLKRLAEQRTQFREVYRAAYLELAAHPQIFDGNPRERVLVNDERVVRLHDKYSENPGEIAFAMAFDPKPGRKPWDLVEEIGGEEHDVIGLKLLMVYLLRLVKHAPVTRPGPKG